MLRRCASTPGRPLTSTLRAFHPTRGSIACHTTRPLRQSSKTTAAAATTISSLSTTPTAEAQASPPTDAELHFYDTFLLSSEDVHLLLLEEAHRKHGVWLNVPPQLAPTAPNVGPPIIPDPLYPPKQKERLDALIRGAAAARLSRTTQRSTLEVNGAIFNESCLAYTPTHQPPPFATTGTRTLWVLQDTLSEGRAGTAGTVAVDSASTATAGTNPMVERLNGNADTAAAAAKSTQLLRTTVTEVAIRAPVDHTMKFHCSCCGRAFRRREAAAEHVEIRHNDNRLSRDVAEVREGAGPGEITGYQHLVGTSMMSSRPTSTALNASTATTNSSEVGKVGLQVDQSTAAASFLKPTALSTETEKGITTTASVTTTTSESTTADASSSSKLNSSSRLLKTAASYLVAPALTLPDDSLIDELLSSVWDEVGLKRADIEKAAGVQTGSSKCTTSAGSERAAPLYTVAVDSCNGKFFIPSSAFVEGKADIRAELEAELATKPLARATPEGAAPGVKRASVTKMSAMSNGGVGGGATSAARRLQLRRRNPDGTFTFAGADTTYGVGNAATGGLSTAPTAQDLTIAELSRHYPNPFGDSPNAALVEQDKEPINPFRDLEGEAEAFLKHTTAALKESEGSKEDADDGNTCAMHDQKQLFLAWQRRFATRPYACPICQRRALPSMTDALKKQFDRSLARAAGERDAHTATTASSSSCEPAFSVSGSGSGRTAAPVASASKSKSRAGPRLSNAQVNQAPTSVASPFSFPSSNPATTIAVDGVLPMEVNEEAWQWYEAQVPRFRLLDALEDHIEACHDACDSPVNTHYDHRSDGVEAQKQDEVSDDDWRRLYGTAALPKESAEAELLAVCRLYRAVFSSISSSTSITSTIAAVNAGKDQRALTTSTKVHKAGKEEDNTNKSAGADNTDDTSAGSGAHQRPKKMYDSDNGGGSGSGGLSLLGVEGEMREALTTAAEAPHVHVRSAVNTVLVGVVRDVQEGFVGSTQVLQYVLSIRNDKVSTSIPINTERATKSTSADGEESNSEGEELVVVRCMGDLVPVALLHHQVHVGATLFVTGTLRMNRNVDTTSRRSHAYPYVQVVPPLGSVRVLK